jgi:hypothetical protein
MLMPEVRAIFDGLLGGPASSSKTEEIDEAEEIGGTGVLFFDSSFGSGADIPSNDRAAVC